MAFYHRMPTRYVTLIPAVYFAGLGSFDIISDVLDRELTTTNFLINLVLFAPLILRHWSVYIVSGVLSGLFALYAFLAIFVWYIKYLGGFHFRYPFETLVIAPAFAFLTLLCGLSLVYAGRLSRNEKVKRACGYPQPNILETPGNIGNI